MTLATRCDRLLACDAVLDAVASARARTAALPGVHVERGPLAAAVVALVAALAAVIIWKRAKRS